MADINKGLAERVEVFTRATSDALQKAVGEVLDARNPWQLLYRLSRIVLPGLVLYTAWLLITLQPDLAKRMSTTHFQSLQEQVSAHQSQVHSLLRSAIETGGDGLHTLALLQWDGGSSASVLAAAGRVSQLGLSAEQELLLGVEMARALGHLALGLCASEQPEALPLNPDPSASAGARASAALLCPVGCDTSPGHRALLLSLYDERQSPAQTASHTGASEKEQWRRQEELLLIARRLGELLADGGPGAGHGKSQ
ncbi:MAG: hypothetical protein WAM11_15305 [Cyanobium sp.]